MSKHKRIEIISRGVCVSGGKLLLCHSKGASNTYLPGGHVEFNESAAVSLCREIREELGVRSTVRRFLGAVENTFIQEGKRHCEVNLVFEISIRGVTPSRPPASCEDYIEFLWVPLSRLSRSALQPSVLRKLIPLWLKRTAAPWASTY